MTDTIARTIAALRRYYNEATGLYNGVTFINVRPEDILAICDAAEASLRAAEREQKMREELEAVTVAASDPRINNTMSLEEWVREQAGLRCPPREPTQAMLDAGSLVFHREQQKMIPKWEPSIAARFWRAMWDAAPKINEDK